MSDDEEEVLLQRRPAFMGLRFKSDEHKDLILKLMLSSAAEFFFSLILIVAHVLNNGLLHHIFFHALAITLPGIAYSALFRSSPRLMYIFEMANWEFAIIHSAIWLIIFMRWYSLVSQDEVEACSYYVNGEITDPRYARCIDDWKDEKEKRSTLLVAWTLLTLPLFVVQLYAGFLAHEYYFQMRVQKLVMKRGRDGDNVALVEEDNGQGQGRPVRYAEDIDGE
mmetsp:Transcript_28665/g.66094  ORF Transcript_28665/g.66094 Transcript_28665/m.66094 type:complete len:223 (-) Transcript_28665:44-712(-)